MKYCSGCGKKVANEAKFCGNCGSKLNGYIKNNGVKKEDSTGKSLSKSQRNVLIKRYRDTGGASIVISILGLIVSVLVSLSDYTIEEIVVGAVIILLFLIPFYYYGKKLKDNDASNLDSALTISRGMLIYTIVFIVVSLLLGGAGWLWFILLYYYYKSYKETRDALKI